MSVGSDPRRGSEVAGYRLEDLLGRGGMGAVYRAEDLRLGRKVALKLLAPELAENERFRERFLRESQLAASLDHPHIVPIYAAGEAAGQLYLAMRYVQGYDLKQLLAREGPLAPGRALGLLEQVADALDAAHERGLIHRDVKPGNILIAERAGREHCYLADFGLTKQTSSISGLTGTGELVGTVAYVSPEQIRGEAVDARADVYALGCVLYECLTGEQPFARESDVAMLWAHVNDSPPAVATELGGEIDRVLVEALAKAPADRPQSCGELVASARAALGLTAPAAPSVRRRRSLRLRRPRGRLAALLGAVGAGLVAAALAVFVLGQDAAPIVILPNSVALIDAETGEVTAQIPVGIRPGPVAVGGGSVWVGNLQDRTLTRIDERQREAVGTISLGNRTPTGLAVGRDAVWVAHGLRGQLSRVEPQFGEVTTIDVAATAFGSPNGTVALGGGAVWVVFGDSTLARIDPAAFRKTGSTFAGAQPAGVVVGGDSVWVVNSGDATIHRFSPSTFEQGPLRTTNVGRRPSGIAYGESAIWVTNTADDLVTRIDPGTASSLLTIPVGDGPTSIAVGAGAVWVANTDAGTISRIDPSTNEVVRTLDVGNRPSGISVSDDVLWVTVQAE